MLFSYGSNSNEMLPNISNKSLTQAMLPNTKPWIMCIGENNREYYMNIFTHKITDVKPSYFKEYDKRVNEEINKPLLEELEMLQRKLHIIEGKAYEESFQNTTDVNFQINPTHTHEKGDTVLYIPNDTDPLIRATVVAVHPDKPPFYSISYKLENGEIVEKNTTAPRIVKIKKK